MIEFGIVRMSCKAMQGFNGLQVHFGDVAVAQFVRGDHL